MHTDSGLERIAKNSGFTPYFYAEKNIEDANKCRHFIREFLISYQIEFIEDTNLRGGYRIGKEGQRWIEGIHPLDVEELCVFLVYAAQIIFRAPSLSFALDFVKKSLLNSEFQSYQTNINAFVEFTNKSSHTKSRKIMNGGLSESESSGRACCVECNNC